MAACNLMNECGRSKSFTCGRLKIGKPRHDKRLPLSRPHLGQEHVNLRPQGLAIPRQRARPGEHLHRRGVGLPRRLG